MEGKVRGWSFVLLAVVILTLAIGSVPALALAQDEAAAVPDPSLVEVAGNECAWLNTGEEDVVALLEPVTCGTLVVPENWQAPGERRLDIEFVVLESTGDDPAADPVVYLAGGPGGSSLDGVPFFAELFAGFRQHRDVILYDQRGTGRSSPLQCSDWTIDDLFGLDLSEATGAASDPATPAVADDLTTDAAASVVAGVELGPTAAITADRLLTQARADVSEAMARCAQELLATGVDLRQYNSVASARDLIALLRALAYDTYNLYGISYGTRLALVVMREFPQSGLRSVVLDSTYPPGLEGFEQYPAEPHEVVIQLFADCYLDPVCNDAYPNLMARFVQLLDRLAAEPLDIGDGLMITAADVVEVMQGINGMVQIAPYIPLMIHELERGEAETFLGIVTGALFADPAAERDVVEEEATPVPAATPVEEADAAAAELKQVLDQFLMTIGAVDGAGTLSPAQAFLGEVLATVAALPEGPANELTIRLLLLDKLPESRTTLRQFVERAFADRPSGTPTLATERDSLLAAVADLGEADIQEVFAYLSGPLQLLETTNVALNQLTFNSVECNESVPFQRFENTVQTAVGLQIPALGLNMVPRIAQQFAICEVWPSGRALDVANQPVASNVPTLILAGAYDLQTPVSWNKEAFVHLPNAGLLIFPMSGHGVITFSQCAADVTAQFVADPIYYPDSSCIADLYPEWVLPAAR